MQFKSMSEDAKKVLMCAGAEAAKLGHSIVNPEHILLGLVTAEDDVVSPAMVKAGLTAEAIRDHIIRNCTTSLPIEFDVETLELSPRARNIIEIAEKQAAKIGLEYVPPEILFTALIEDHKSLAFELIDQIPNKESFLSSIAVNLKKASTKTVKTPKLDKFSKDLTAAARKGNLDPIIGRSDEIERIIQILSRRTKNNPVLIGEPGVGKTAIIEGLAQKIVKGDVPSTLLNKRVLSLDLSGMIAGTRFRGDFEERLKDSINEAIESGNVIVFIDELHTLIGAGSSEGTMDASNILKPALARGELQAMGATTLEEYRKYIEKDAALERRFQPVVVCEPSEQEALAILHGIKGKYQDFHGITITDEAIEAAVKLSVRYIPDRFLPDKAIDLLDEAASRTRISLLKSNPDVAPLEKKLEELSSKKKIAMTAFDFGAVATIRDDEAKVIREIEGLTASMDRSKRVVNGEIVAEVLSAWMHIPVTKLNETEAERLVNLEDILHKKIIGQNDAVIAVARSVRRARTGLKDPNKPIGSFLFMGPTGVGKTALAKALGEALFGDSDSMIRIDMSEYMEKHTVSKLIGSPPGYVGYDDGGQLTEKVRRKPYSIVLFDEIEKAHPDVFNSLLQIMDDGRLTDSRGRVVDFRNTVIIMTSNVGAQAAQNKTPMGFTAQRDASYEYEVMKDRMMHDLKKVFKPEFLNRIDDIVVFHALTKGDTRAITDIMIEEIAKRLNDKGMSVSISGEVRDYLSESGFDPDYGARPLRRAIQRLIEDNLAEYMLKGRIKMGDAVEAVLQDKEIVFNSVSK